VLNLHEVVDLVLQPGILDSLDSLRGLFKLPEFDFLVSRLSFLGSLLGLSFSLDRVEVKHVGELFSKHVGVKS